MASNNTVSKRKKPDEKKEKVKKEKPAPLGLNKYGAVLCSILLSVALYHVIQNNSPDNLTSQPYLPLVYPECCTGTEDQLTRLWGSYRPQVYFGMRPRIPESVIFGLMWMRVRHRGVGNNDFRHTSEQNQLQSFTWTRHDGNKFGVQVLKDDGFDIETSFAKTNVGLQDWSAKIKVYPAKTGTPPKAVSLFLYLGIEHSRSSVQIQSTDSGAVIHGETVELGKFKMIFKSTEAQQIWYTGLVCHPNVPLYQLTAYVQQNLQQYQIDTDKHFLALPPPTESGCDTNSNAVVVQLILPLSAKVMVIYENMQMQRGQSLDGLAYDRLLKSYIKEFDDKFEDKFKLKSKGYSKGHIEFSKNTFSNLIGGIGYFYGKSAVKSSKQKTPMNYWAASLYTAVPSRSFFPRGFLWDEGFHQLLISKWDKTISLEVIGHWLNLMNANGWIPREQILGNEALMKVPPEFVVQNADYANPPTLFLAVESLIDSMEPAELLDHHGTLRKMFHRMSLWYDWYNTTQTGTVPTTYRWRGRNSTTDQELNPKTLTSGLDDYPRATHPSNEEYHLDLRCWVAFASRSLATLGELIGIEVSKYKQTADVLSDNEALRKLHWAGDMFADWGNHSDNVGLAPRELWPGGPVELRRKVLKLPKPQFVKVKGYIALFPFILTLLEPSSPELGIILKGLESDTGMRGPYGLCSIAKGDKYYKKYNTRDDAPYWRGPIWININYLAIRALNHYSKLPGPYQTLSKTIYTQLRNSIVENMYSEYTRTGYIWEQYDCKTGKGQSVHPFTGWSSLVVLIMGEQY